MNLLMRHLRESRRIIGTLLCVLLTLGIAAPISAATVPGIAADSPQQGASSAAARTIVVYTPIYAGPGTGFWVLGGLRKDAVVPVVGVTADHQFWQANTPVGVGFVSAANVEVANGESVPVVDPGPVGTVTTGAANVRGGPGIGARRLAVIAKGSQFFLIGRQPDGSWLQIRYRFGTGWIEASLTDLGGSATASTVAPTTQGPRAIVNAAFLNVRSGPGAQFTRIGALVGGTVVPIIGRTPDGSWLLVTTEFGNGWINILHVITKDYFGNAPVTSAAETGGTVAYTGFTRTTVNLRSGPNIGFSSLGSVEGNTELSILGQSPDMAWWYVEAPLGKGWINKSLVRVMGDYSALPVIE